MSKAVICNCKWPEKIYKTTTGHSRTCPVEKTARKERKVEFYKIIGKENNE